MTRIKDPIDSIHSPQSHRALWPFLHPDDTSAFHTALSAAIYQTPGQRVSCRLRSPHHVSGYLKVDASVRYGRQGVVLFLRPEAEAMPCLLAYPPPPPPQPGLGQQHDNHQQLQRGAAQGSAAAAAAAAPLGYAVMAPQQHHAAHQGAPASTPPVPSSASSAASPGPGGAARGGPSF